MGTIDIMKLVEPGSFEHQVLKDRERNCPHTHCSFGRPQDYSTITCEYCKISLTFDQVLEIRIRASMERRF